jgi:probable blue pigment (indigoidine) exporter
MRSADSHGWRRDHVQCRHRADQALGPPRGHDLDRRHGLDLSARRLTLLPATLLVEGLPDNLTARNIGGLIYLVLVSGILAYALWFWGLQRLSASAVTFLTLLNPVTAAVLGWVVLDQRLNFWQLLGAVLILISVLLGQPPGTFDWRRRRRSALASRV